MAKLDIFGAAWYNRGMKNMKKSLDKLGYFFSGVYWVGWILAAGAWEALIYLFRTAPKKWAKNHYFR
jgi:hypothetical protein